jgi:hypothetical protein
MTAKVAIAFFAALLVASIAEARVGTYHNQGRVAVGIVPPT